MTRDCWLYFSILIKELKQAFRYIDQRLLRLKNIDLSQKLKRQLKVKVHLHVRKIRKTGVLSIEKGKQTLIEQVPPRTFYDDSFDNGADFSEQSHLKKLLVTSFILFTLGTMK